MNIDAVKVGVWAALGGGAGALVTIVVAGQASQQAFAAVLNNPAHFLPLPVVAGAVCGAAIGFLKK